MLQGSRHRDSHALQVGFLEKWMTVTSVPSATCRRQDDLVMTYGMAPVACHPLLWEYGSGPRV